MRKFALLAVVVLLLLPAFSYGFSTKGQDCSKCHTLKKEEAAALLKELAPNAKVLDIRTLPLKTMWEVDVDTGGKKGIVYIDFSKKYLISGALIDIKAKKNLTRERFVEFNKIDVSKIPLKDALVMGNANAPHKVIVFSDPDCPSCAKLHQEMKKVVAARKDIVFFIKMTPIHKESYDKAKSIVCEKSLILLDNAFEKKQIPKPKCKTTIIDDNIALGKALGIPGLPAVILSDGRIIPGYQDANALKTLIDKK